MADIRVSINLDLNSNLDEEFNKIQKQFEDLVNRFKPVTDTIPKGLEKTAGKFETMRKSALKFKEALKPIAEVKKSLKELGLDLDFLKFDFGKVIEAFKKLDGAKQSLKKITGSVDEFYKSLAEGLYVVLKPILDWFADAENGAARVRTVMIFLASISLISLVLAFAALDAAAIAAGAAVIGIAALMTALYLIAEDLFNFFKNGPSGSDTIFEKLLRWIGLSSKEIQALRDRVVWFVDVLITGAKWIWDHGLKKVLIYVGLFIAVMTTWPWLVVGAIILAGAVIVAKWDAIWTAVKNGINSFVNWISNAWDSIVSFISENGTLIRNIILTLLFPPAGLYFFRDEILNVFNRIYNWIMQTDFVKGLLKSFEDLKARAKALFTEFKKWISDILNFEGGSVNGSSIRESVEKLKGWVMSAWDSIVNFISENGTLIRNIILTVLFPPAGLYFFRDEILNVFNRIYNWIMQTDFIKGLLKSFEDLKARAKGVFAEFKAWLLDLFDFKLPFFQSDNGESPKQAVGNLFNDLMKNDFVKNSIKSFESLRGKAVGLAAKLKNGMKNFCNFNFSFLSSINGKKIKQGIKKIKEWMYDAWESIQNFISERGTLIRNIVLTVLFPPAGLYFFRDEIMNIFQRIYDWLMQYDFFASFMGSLEDMKKGAKQLFFDLKAWVKDLFTFDLPIFEKMKSVGENLSKFKDNPSLDSFLNILPFGSDQKDPGNSSQSNLVSQSSIRERNAANAYNTVSNSTANRESSFTVNMGSIHIQSNGDGVDIATQIQDHLAEGIRKHLSRLAGESEAELSAG